jgi:hypothetical protein
MAPIQKRNAIVKKIIRIALGEAGKPEGVASGEVVEAAGQDLKAWFREPKNRRITPSKFEAVGYVPVRNYDAKDGFWKVYDRRQ